MPERLRSHRPLAGLAYDRVKPSDMGLAAHAQRAGISTEIDPVSATAASLAADRAMAMHKRVGRIRFQAEPHGAALA
jgi:hypothetical protein